MMKQINRFFSVILLGACLAGMFIPSFGESTAIIVIVSLALIIFSSFFQINLSFQSLMTDFKISVLFVQSLQGSNAFQFTVYQRDTKEITGSKTSDAVYFAGKPGLIVRVVNNLRQLLMIDPTRDSLFGRNTEFVFS